MRGRASGARFNADSSLHPRICISESAKPIGEVLGWFGYLLVVIVKREIHPWGIGLFGSRPSAFSFFLLCRSGIRGWEYT